MKTGAFLAVRLVPTPDARIRVELIYEDADEPRGQIIAEPHLPTFENVQITPSGAILLPSGTGYTLEIGEAGTLRLRDTLKGLES